MTVPKLALLSGSTWAKLWAQTLALAWGRQREWARALWKEPRLELMTELEMALETELQLVRMMAEVLTALVRVSAKMLGHQMVSHSGLVSWEQVLVM